MKLRFTTSARRQFLHAVANIMEDNLDAALKFRKKVESTLRRLTRFPDAGRLIPEFPDLPFREIVIRPYRFFYRRQDQIIWVVACWHGAQLPKVPKVEVT